MIASVSLLLLGVAVADAADGAADSSKPAWSVHAGFPWTGVQYSPSSSEGFHWVAQAETALFRRWESSAGLRYSRAAGHHLSLQVGVSAGWISQQGTLSRQGPQATAHLRIQRTGRYIPRLEHRTTAFWAQARGETDYQGLEDRVGAFTPLRSHSWEFGLGIPLASGLLLEPAMRFGSVDDQFALPALSLGLRSAP